MCCLSCFCCPLYCLSFFFLLCCLSFFVWRILITPLIYSNSSCCGVASTSCYLTTQVWHYLHLWDVVISEKGYPIGYRPFVPLFVPGILHTMASKEKQCTGLCVNDLWVIHESVLILCLNIHFLCLSVYGTMAICRTFKQIELWGSWPHRISK